MRTKSRTTQNRQSPNATRCDKPKGIHKETTCARDSEEVVQKLGRADRAQAKVTVQRDGHVFHDVMPENETKVPDNVRQYVLANRKQNAQLQGQRGTTKLHPRHSAPVPRRMMREPKSTSDLQHVNRACPKSVCGVVRYGETARREGRDRRKDEIALRFSLLFR